MMRRREPEKCFGGLSPVRLNTGQKLEWESQKKIDGRGCNYDKAKSLIRVYRKLLPITNG